MGGDPPLLDFGGILMHEGKNFLKGENPPNSPTLSPRWGNKKKSIVFEKKLGPPPWKMAKTKRKKKKNPPFPSKNLKKKNLHINFVFHMKKKKKTVGGGEKKGEKTVKFAPQKIKK